MDTRSANLLFLLPIWISVGLTCKIIDISYFGWSCLELENVLSFGTLLQCLELFTAGSSFGWSFVLAYCVCDMCHVHCTLKLEPVDIPWDINSFTCQQTWNAQCWSDRPTTGNDARLSNLHTHKVLLIAIICTKLWILRSVTIVLSCTCLCL